MEKLAVCEKHTATTCLLIATAGAKNNALRTGEDQGEWLEDNNEFHFASGTINIVLLTNFVLTDGAMARAIITATEAKTSVLQDRDVRSNASPHLQATGTGTDSIVIVSGTDSQNIIHYMSRLQKLGELIGMALKIS
jgi:adenosylcobinamide amidohydrolase